MKLATTVPQALRKAADLIQKNGLCVGTYTRNGRFCVIGAVNKVTTGRAHAPSNVIADRAIQTLNKLTGPAPSDSSLVAIAYWSDKCRSKARAAALLRKAAVIAAKEARVR